MKFIRPWCHYLINVRQSSLTNEESDKIKNYELHFSILHRTTYTAITWFFFLFTNTRRLKIEYVFLLVHICKCYLVHYVHRAHSLHIITNNNITNVKLLF